MDGGKIMDEWMEEKEWMNGKKIIKGEKKEKECSWLFFQTNFLSTT